MKSHFGWFLVMSFAVLSDRAWADSSRISIPDETVVELGMGYNTVSGELGEPCVQGSSLIIPSDSVHAGLQKSEFELRKIEDVSELKGGLELSLSAVFGLGSYVRDPKFSYFSQNDPSRNSVTLMVRSRVVTKTVGMRGLQLKGSFSSSMVHSLESVSAEGKAAFLASCGNQFVQTMSWGGEFLALVKFEAESEAKKQKISGFLATLIAWVKGSADLSRDFSEETRGSKISIQIIRRGGVGDGPGLEIDKLIDYAKNFQSVVTPDAGSVPLSAETRSYEMIRGVSKANYFNLSAQESILSQYEHADLKARTLMSQWVEVQDHPEKYELLESSQLQSSITQLSSILSQIESSVRGCASDLLDGCVYREPDWPHAVIPVKRSAEPVRWSPPMDGSPSDPLIDVMGLDEETKATELPINSVGGVIGS